MMKTNFSTMYRCKQRGLLQFRSLHEKRKKRAKQKTTSSPIQEVEKKDTPSYLLSMIAVGLQASNAAVFQQKI